MRWVIGGDCGKDAFDVLEHAVKKAKSLYPELDKVVVYNNLPKGGMKRLEALGLPLINGHDHPAPWKLEKAEWLFWPARLRKDAHEICMDNDLVLLKRVPAIDDFLADEDMFVTCESYFERHYGNYDDVVPESPRGVNSGLYCMPPGFDFEAWLVKFFEKAGRREYDHLNPQGVIGAMILDQKKRRIIPKHRIPISPIMREIVMEDELPNLAGVHFSGINRVRAVDTWAIYKSLAMRNGTWL